MGPPPPAKPAKQKKEQVALEKSLRLHTCKTRLRPRKGCNNYFTKTFFLQNSLSCPHTYLGAGRHRKSPLDGATDFLATLHSQFFVNFHFGFDPKMPLSVSELGLNIIQFISNLYVGVFLTIAGLVSIPCMLEKDCNGISISTFPPCYVFQMIWPLD